MKKNEIVKKLGKIEEELVNLSLALCDFYLEDIDNKEIDNADTSLNSAIDNVLDTIRNLSKAEL